MQESLDTSKVNVPPGETLTTLNGANPLPKLLRHLVVDSSSHALHRSAAHAYKREPAQLSQLCNAPRSFTVSNGRTCACAMHTPCYRPSRFPQSRCETVLEWGSKPCKRTSFQSQDRKQGWTWGRQSVIRPFQTAATVVTHMTVSFAASSLPGDSTCPHVWPLHKVFLLKF